MNYRTRSNYPNGQKIIITVVRRGIESKLITRRERLGVLEWFCRGDARSRHKNPRHV